MKKRVLIGENDHVLRRLVGEIESVRMKKRDQWHDKIHPSGKRFTQEEICWGPCPTYRNLLVGRSRQLPSRKTIQAIADYLECSMGERNDLLICAEYLPETVDLEGTLLEAMLTSLKSILHQLPFPAYILTRDWTIHDVNLPFTLLWGGSNLSTSPDQKRSLIHLIFDSALPFRNRVGTQQLPWSWHAQSSVALFRQRVKEVQYDRLYQEQITLFRTLPDFGRYWDARPELAEDVLLNQFECVGGTSATQMRVQYFSLSIHSIDYPQICAYVPSDAAARNTYLEWDSSVSEYDIAPALRTFADALR